MKYQSYNEGALHQTLVLLGVNVDNAIKLYIALDQAARSGYEGGFEAGRLAGAAFVYDDGYDSGYADGVADGSAEVVDEAVEDGIAAFNSEDVNAQAVGFKFLAGEDDEAVDGAQFDDELMKACAALDAIGPNG